MAFGSLLVGLAITLNVGWILLNWRQVALLVLGIVFFVAIITGLILNTIFLVREIRRNEQHDAFINSVTHELKTPIASVRLYLETLKTRDLDETQRREFYDVMLADCDRLIGTVEQVLLAGRTRDRRRKIANVQLDVSELVGDCIDLARRRYGLAEDALRFSPTDSDSEPTRVNGDPEELRVAVSNLIDNAIKYSFDDVAIAAEVAPLDDRRVSIKVTDRGIGIPPGQLKRIFNRFYRVPSHIRMRAKGTGLGLFIVRSIVEKHGGKVFADSAGEGRGTTITILLPRV